MFYHSTDVANQYNTNELEMGGSLLSGTVEQSSLIWEKMISSLIVNKRPRYLKMAMLLLGMDVDV